MIGTYDSCASFAVPLNFNPGTFLNHEEVFGILGILKLNKYFQNIIFTLGRQIYKCGAQLTPQTGLKRQISKYMQKMYFAYIPPSTYHWVWNG